jgi:hypothetical protein
LQELNRQHNVQLEKRWHLQNEFQNASPEMKTEIQKNIDVVTEDIERLDAAILGYR